MGSLSPPLGRSALSDRGRSERRAVKARFVVSQAHEGHGARRVPGAGGRRGRVCGSAVGWWARCGVTGLTLDIITIYVITEK